MNGDPGDAVSKRKHAAIDGEIESVARKPPSSAVKFIPSPTWNGQKPGYYFGTSSNGTGYHLDERQQLDSNPTKKAKRSVQIAEDRNETLTIPRRAQPSGELLLQQAEQEQASRGGSSGVIDLTPKGVRIATRALIKAVEKNELQRAQYAPHQPEAYMDSEVALYEQIVAWKAIAANPSQLFPILVKDRLELQDGGDVDANNAGGVLTIFEQLLLQHENDDIVTSVLSVLLEWLDPALLVAEGSGQDEDMSVVQPVVQVGAIVLQDFAELLVDGVMLRIQRNSNRQATSDNGSQRDEDDDEVGNGVDTILSLIENFLEMELTLQATDTDSMQLLLPDGMSVAAKWCKDTTIVSWLLQQIDDNSSRLQDRSLELLALLAPREDLYTIIPDWSNISVRQPAVIEDDDNRKPAAKPNGSSKDTKTTIDGIEILLQVVANYRKKQPEDDQQVETLENACIILAAALTFSTANVKAFVEAQGIELVVRCLKERVHAGGVTLKWIDFAGSDAVHRKACEHLVEAGALKYLFPLFMGRHLPKPAPAAAATKKAKKEWTQDIEMTTIRILYGLVRHLTDDSPDEAKARLLAKFIDTDKCDRLVELCIMYDQKARTAEYKFFKSEAEELLDDPEAVQLAALDAKLAGGGDIFHRIGAIIAFCCVGSKRCHEQILSQLKVHQSGIGLVRDAVEEFASSLADDEQRTQLEGYLERI